MLRRPLAHLIGPSSIYGPSTSYLRLQGQFKHPTPSGSRLKFFSTGRGPGRPDRNPKNLRLSTRNRLTEIDRVRSSRPTPRPIASPRRQGVKDGPRFPIHRTRNASPARHNQAPRHSEPRIQRSSPDVLPPAFREGLTEPPSDDSRLDITDFADAPLQPGLKQGIVRLIGDGSKPTPIQSLSMSRFLVGRVKPGVPTLLASETGSGKSLAYLIPVIQSLKSVERQKDPQSRSPRAIILCPTHELCRQIAVYAKALSHEVKLRVICSSNPNKGAKEENWNENQLSEKGVLPSERPVDIFVGTPSRIRSMIQAVDETPKDAASETPISRLMSVDDVKWLVVDEADVMLGRDFSETTESIIKKIQQATALRSDTPSNLIFSTATIPVALSNYLESQHPGTKRLVSRRVHRLPKGLKMEYVQLTGGNRYATITQKLEEVRAEDAANTPSSPSGSRGKGKVIIFCNKPGDVARLAEYMSTKNIKPLSIAPGKAGRDRGSNKHISAFLSSAAQGSTSTATNERVLITTSLLSRGLDFHEDVRHVFVVDQPRNAVDFIHRAGRTGRAGRQGTVVIFEKGSRRDRRAAKPKGPST